MSISVGIMTHPKRQENCRELIRQLPSAFYINDIHSEGCWANAKKCWQYGIQSNLSHILILQDDIILCDNFLHDVHEIVKYRPNDPISLFTPFNNFKLDKGIRWLKLDKFLFSQALIMPRNLAIKCLNWIDQVIDKVPLNEDQRQKELDDVKFASFFIVHKIPVYITLPNLVEHIEDSSLLGHIYKRKSVWWEKDISGYNWGDLRYSTFSDPKPMII